ncbi:hypothetical protein [Gordonia mangrovi]|nr:hypothetical protein [Gordonia mangrovi]UVF80528.1 hypothetical protein NWF22_00315 [Gordonia mangrovi]
MLGRRDRPGLTGVDDPDLIVVAESGDDAVASSAALASSAWRAGDEVVLRHVLRLPERRVADAIATAALDGYRPVDPSADDDSSADTAGTGEVIVLLARVQLLDAVHLSQERSRMASLGSRHSGEALRWQVLQPPVARR